MMTMTMMMMVNQECMVSLKNNKEIVMSWINKISIRDLNQAKFDAAVLRLNRLSREIVMTQDQYDFLYKEIVKKFDDELNK